MTKLRAALFDFDGTLCDSIATIIRLVQLACE
ncbi:MAG: haloacid dehalogenase, partial [Alphaproteobacteria bacterium]|nr:haloacid dehalogenase [Alphaproteobacteria bacterium]